MCFKTHLIKCLSACSARVRWPILFGVKMVNNRVYAGVFKWFYSSTDWKLNWPCFAVRNSPQKTGTLMSQFKIRYPGKRRLWIIAYHRETITITINNTNNLLQLLTALPLIGLLLKFYLYQRKYEKWATRSTSGIMYRLFCLCSPCR